MHSVPCTAVFGYDMPWLQPNVEERQNGNEHGRKQRKKEWNPNGEFIYVHGIHIRILCLSLCACIMGNGSARLALSCQISYIQYGMLSHHIHTSLNIRIQLSPNQQRHTQRHASSTYTPVSMPVSERRSRHTVHLSTS